MRRKLTYIAKIIGTALLIYPLNLLLKLLVKLGEDAGLGWLNIELEEWWVQFVGVITWVVAIILAGAAVWLVWTVARWTLPNSILTSSCDHRAGVDLGERTISHLTINLHEVRCVQTFNAESLQPRTALYFEVLTTLSSNRVMQIGDIELDLPNGIRIKAQEKPVNTLERAESH